MFCAQNTGECWFIHTTAYLPPSLLSFLPFLLFFIPSSLFPIESNDGVTKWTPTYIYMYVYVCACVCVGCEGLRVVNIFFYWWYWMNEHRALLVWYWEGITKVPIPVPSFPLIIPHGLVWDWIQASLMRGQQLTAQAKHNLALNINIMTFWYVQPCTPSLVVGYQATFWRNMVLPCSVPQVQAADLFETSVPAATDYMV